MQVVGHKIPINGVSFSWSTGSAVGVRSQDNYFIINPGKLITFKPLKVTITGVNGEVLNDFITFQSSVVNGQLILGTVQFAGSSALEEETVVADAEGVNSVLAAVLALLAVLILTGVVVAVVIIKRAKNVEKV
eukprot:TRINITY_DN249_c0_g1_i2.p1 TRINITY_DN249_c0_g1~~TRINITY_DN249_c0_g1_i2.p1  ORF type:complete len:133 (+),score=24.47 TRINITY_DN249_c0_g1_i2:263-661(+)